MIIKFFEHHPVSSSFENLVGHMQYFCLPGNKIPDDINVCPNLAKKWNCAVVYASGSQNDMCYGVIGCRPDNNNTVIDEDVFIFYYDYSNPNSSFAIQVLHGNWPRRTSTLSPEQTTSINVCGLTTNINFKSIPQATSGSLFDIYESGELRGVSASFNLLQSVRNDPCKS